MWEVAASLALGGMEGTKVMWKMFWNATFHPTGEQDLAMHTLGTGIVQFAVLLGGCIACILWMRYCDRVAARRKKF